MLHDHVPHHPAMPATYQVDPSRRLVTTILHGILRDGDFKEYVAALLADPRFDPTYDNLVDGCGITELEVTSRAVRASADTDPFSPTTRRAIVVSGDAAYGMARMFQALCPDLPDRLLVTRDPCEARRWLGVE